MPSRRQERVGKRVVQELAEALRNLKHANAGFVTITRCEMSPDLRHARVFVSVFGDEAERERGLGVLFQNASRLRGMVGRKLGIKVMPELHFEFDETLETADSISRLIRDARKTDANPNPLTPEEEQALTESMAAKKGKFSQPSDADQDVDVFEAARLDVEEELLDDDDPDWQPINLDELPEDGENDD